MDKTVSQSTEPSDAEIARREALAARVEALGNSLKKKRAEAIAGRKNSGIEDEWRIAEDAYQGIDDANRGSTAVGKPSSPNGGITSGQPVQVGTRSTIVLNITRPYVDAAAARVSDMLLPTDDTPWGDQADAGSVDGFARACCAGCSRHAARGYACDAHDGSRTRHAARGSCWRSARGHGPAGAGDEGCRR